MDLPATGVDLPGLIADFWAWAALWLPGLIAASWAIQLIWGTIRDFAGIFKGTSTS